MDPKKKMQMLCVDDEPALLEGLSHILHRRYKVHTATSGEAALEVLRREKEIAIVVSDMRMPGMTGAELLAQSRKIAPDAVRLLLTGQSSLENAIAAVNDGQIFRFLTKPCPAPMFEVAIDAAAAQYRLITAERELLEETLRGSVRMLTDVLALTSPLSFGRTTRIKQTALALARALSLKDEWQLEVAAMFSQIGLIVLPPEVLEKVSAGQPLNEAETQMSQRANKLSEQLLAHIPRLEKIGEILAGTAKAPVKHDPLLGPLDPDAQARITASQILRVAHDVDVLEAQDLDTETMLATMKGRGPERYEGEILGALIALRGGQKLTRQIRELSVAQLRPGMTVAEDVRMTNGALLVSRGFEVTESFVERARNFRPGAVREPIRTLIRGATSAPNLTAAG